MWIDHDAMVLVADGRKMLFFRNKGDRMAPNLEAETVKLQENPPRSGSIHRPVGPRALWDGRASDHGKHRLS